MIFQSINQFGSVSVASKRTANVRSEHSLLMVDARQGVVVGFFYFFLDLPRHTHTHTHGSLYRLVLFLDCFWQTALNHGWVTFVFLRDDDEFTRNSWCSDAYHALTILTG